MDRTKFYIYSSNIAIILFGIIFMLYGFTKQMYVLIILGLLLSIYGSFRFYTMLQALKNQFDRDDIA